MASWVDGAISAQIEPEKYAVRIVMKDGSRVRVYEDEKRVWIQETKAPYAPALVEGTSSGVILPDFKEFTYGAILRVLHHEMLINMRHGVIYPNIFVYKHPWYRDGAMLPCVQNVPVTWS